MMPIVDHFSPSAVSNCRWTFFLPLRSLREHFFTNNSYISGRGPEAHDSGVKWPLTEGFYRFLQLLHIFLGNNR